MNKKLKRKRIIIIIGLLILVTVQIVAFGLSRAKDVQQILVNVIDQSGLLSNEQCTLNAIDDGKSGYAITLPSFLNEKSIISYYIKKANITTENIADEVVEKIPGDTIYLTQEELETKKIELTVLYDTKEENAKLLYHKKIEMVSGDNRLSVSGYMPLDAKLESTEENKVEIEKKIQEKLDANTIIKYFYDVKIVANGEEYNITNEIDRFEIVISKIDTNCKNQLLQAIKNNENKFDIIELTDIQIQEDSMKFYTKNIVPYIVLENKQVTVELNQVENNVQNSPPIVFALGPNSNLGEVWDGTVAIKFNYGDGSANSPYLISNGRDLAFLAYQVNNGNTYEGAHFQLTNDINLNNREWTPIGTYENSFRGIFNGAGHIISNGKINTPDNYPGNNVTYSYGIFGSIGGGSADCIIQNVEFNNIILTIKATGYASSSGGLSLGIVAGTIYRNGTITNVIAKNCKIVDTGTLSIRSTSFKILIGGIAGDARDTSTSENDPGNGNRYRIDNCFAMVDFELYNISTRSMTYAGQYNIGGIIGRIRSQPVWPEYCLYSGNMNANGIAGPIFGVVRDNTSSSSTNNFATLWNGNDAGNLTITSYYANYQVNDTNFTSTVTTGTSTENISTSRYSIGSVQGVNKGIYTNDMNAMLDNFNAHLGSNDVIWTNTGGNLSLVPRLKGSVQEVSDYHYTISVQNNYGEANYTYQWYINDKYRNDLTGNSYSTVATYVEDENVYVVINDGKYYSTVSFVVPRLSISIEFNIDKNNSKVSAYLSGTAISIIDHADYTYQWYQIDISGEIEKVEGANSLVLTNLENGMEYKLIATNHKITELSAENTFIFGDRTVIYVSYKYGSYSNDGLTPDTPVESLNTAYQKLKATGSRNENVIVVMGVYDDDSFLNSATSTAYAKKATITGKYLGVDYGATLAFEGEDNYRYMTADTTFQYLTLDGLGNSWWGSGSPGSVYFYLQGHSLTMGEGIVMKNYTTANTNQGLIEGNAPAFHIIAGWLQYNYATLPNNHPKLLIKSGTYGRIILGGSPGTNSVSNLEQYTSRNFTGSSPSDTFHIEVDINIKNTTTPSNYTYDVNLLVGGAACGNTYANVTENIYAGNIGRVLGASIGDTSNRPSDWNYPINTFLGQTTINVFGGRINELYGGCLGRNMNALTNSSTLICDSYFYGKIIINIIDGIIDNNIYGAGAGGVTGYHANSSDSFKSYGQSYDTAVNINVTGGTINGDIYGGGYGYTEYLTERVTADDGGALYGTSNITISGNPTINGNIYGAGCGYLLSSKNRIAQMIGTSNITITGNPTINGSIFGGGAGITGDAETAKLNGNSTIYLKTNTNATTYGGGNIAQTVGNTNIHVQSGNITGNIYGGGNIGAMLGNANVFLEGGQAVNVFGGGYSADAENTYVYGQGTKTENIYGGSNTSGVVKSSHIVVNSGEIRNIYGGNNEGGTTNISTISVEGGMILESIYGGGNKADTNESHIRLKNSVSKIPNIFGGGYAANVPTTDIILEGASVQNIYGGSNISGNVDTSNVKINTGNADFVYGGNNQGGITTTSYLTINGGTVNMAYGGGNIAETTTTNVQINAGTSNSVFGGGNRAKVTTANVLMTNGIVTNVYGGGDQAEVTNSANLNMQGGTIKNNLYGGGNEGTVIGDTNVNISSGMIEGSLYAGGNGITAIVYGNTNLIVQGDVTIGSPSSKTPESGCVFGGGNAAATGTIDLNNSTSTVNIVGGTIYGNVYGGANTSVVYGYTNLKIGFDAVLDETLAKSDIYIKGTIFGGGEANASGSENYDYSFISVTKGIQIDIDGTGHTNFKTEGSIFGSGNASSTSGESYITIKNYGTIDDPQKNISIQRANRVILDNSNISLSGATDRTNEYSNEHFTLSRVDELKLKNNSTVFLKYGANLLKVLSSLVDVNGVEEKASVVIDEKTGETTRNVDNRIYMWEGKNLNIATNEQVTAYGEINGMLFFGIFTNPLNPSTSTGLYNHNFQNADKITNEGTFSSNSYVMGLHKTNHNTKEDGFYTNYNNEGYIKTNYIATTPEDDVYYIWLVGETMDVVTFEITMTASKYATLGTHELSLTGFSAPNTKFTISGFSAGLAEGISLVDQSEIKAIANTEEEANTIFGLSMKTGKNGWQTISNTNFYTQGGGTYQGSNAYDCDNSTYTPTLVFNFYHSQNLTLEQELGATKIRLQVMTPIDDLNYKISYVDINITMLTAIYQDYFYEASITPGEEFNLFATTETNITEDSKFSMYYSLVIDHFSTNKLYGEYFENEHVLVSRNAANEGYSFPENTKIIMLDMFTNNFYYYVVTKEDVTNQKYEYKFKDFIKIGSNNEYFDEIQANQHYYDKEKDIVYENYIIHVNFEQSQIPQTTLDNTLFIELREKTGQTLLGVLGIQRDVAKYSIYTNKKATIIVDEEITPSTLYLGNQFNLNITTNFTQQVINSKIIYDTKFLEEKLGIKISIYDSNGNKLNSDSLLGITYTLDGVKYYPGFDGTARINIADKVTNVLSRIVVDTSNNKTLATGKYFIKVESFGSPDGIYYGTVTSGSVQKEINIINGSYGLTVSTDENSKIIDKKTGNTLHGNNSLISTINYTSNLANPVITVSLERRMYDSIYSKKYEKVDLKNYVKNTLSPFSVKWEYIESDSPMATTTFFLNLQENLMSGTYRLVFKLYDGTTYIGQDFEYFIVK